MISFGEQIKLDDKQKDRLISKITDKYSEFHTLLEQPRQKMLSQFEDTFVFQFKRGSGRSSLCFPKMYEYLQRIAPRLVAANPKWVVNPKVPKRKEDEVATIQTKESMFELARGSQLYLNYIWELGRCRAKLDEWSISGLVMDIGWACVDFIQKKEKIKESETEVELDEDGNEIETIVETEVEKIVLEYPTFQALDSLNVFFDPRVCNVDDMRAVIVFDDNVTVASLMENEELYYKEAIKELEGCGGGSSADNSKETTKFTIQGIPDVGDQNESVSVKYYFGYFCLDEGEDGKPDYDSEKLVFATLVNDSILLECKELPFMPLEMFSPARVPKQAIGMGALRPIHDLHKAYNLVRNQRFDNVNLVINRMWKMKQGAGIDPRKLNSKPGNVIALKDMDAIEPLTTPDVTNSSYKEAQELDIDMQTATGTISTADTQGEGGFVNTATGQKIRWNEFNARFNYYKDNLEDALARLGAKMLMLTGERATMNPVIADSVSKKFYEIAKDYFNDFQDYFEVGILADSTTYDSVANQRDEAIAKANISKEYKALGVPIDLTRNYIDIMQSFPGSNPQEYLMEEQPAPEPLPQGKPIPEMTQPDVIGPPSLTP